MIYYRTFRYRNRRQQLRFYWIWRRKDRGAEVFNAAAWFASVAAFARSKEATLSEKIAQGRAQCLTLFSCVSSRLGPRSGPDSAAGGDSDEVDHIMDAEIPNPTDAAMATASMIGGLFLLLSLAHSHFVVFI